MAINRGKIKFLDVHRLPYSSGLYFIAINNKILYAGYSDNLPDLMMGNQIISEIIIRYEIRELMIYWLEIDCRLGLVALETSISMLNPIFNLATRK